MKLVIIILLSHILISVTLGQDIKSIIDSVNSLQATEYLSNLYKSKQIFEKNLQQAKEMGYIKGEAKSLSILAVIYYLLNDYEKSTEYNIKALKIFEAQKDYDELANAYGEFGYQMKRRDLEQANEYMLKGIEISEKFKVRKPVLAKLYDNFGVLKEMEGKIDSALLLYNKALKFKFELQDSIGIPYSLNKIANAKALQKKFKEAFDYLRQSDSYRQREISDYGRADNLAYYGDFFAMEGKLDSAISYYKKSLDLSIKNGYTFLIQFIYQQLSELYASKNDYSSSLEYYKRYTAYKDSLTNLATNQKIAELEIAFESSKKDKLIAQKELELRHRAILFITIGTTLLFLVLTLIGLNAYQVQRRKAISAEAELAKRIAIEESNHKIIEEKLRISRELHDNIGSQLTFLISSLDNLMTKTTDENINREIQDASKFARFTLNDLRNTIWAMKNETGNLSTLIIKIRDYINRIKSSTEHIKIDIQDHTKKEYRLNSSQLLNLFRIFQECIQNVLKHSLASEFKMIFNDSSEGFSMRICDNGKGIEISENLESTGLESLQIRAKEANGDFVILNSDGNKVMRGTEMIFEIKCEAINNTSFA